MSPAAESLLVLTPQAEDLAARLAPALPGELAVVAASDADAARQRGAGATIALASPDLLAQVLDDLPQLRWAQSTWAGVRPLVDHPRRDYCLTGVRGIFDQSMAEFVLGWLLAIERRIIERSRARQWEGQPDGTLAGRQLGILGTGALGQAVARACAPFGLSLHGLNRRGSDAPGFDQLYAAEDRLTLAARCDYLVALLPDTPTSGGFVDAAMLDALPSHAVLINGGRGTTVDTGAVVKALERRRLRAAVLDVFEREPLADDDPLWRVDNLYITSHTAAPTAADAIAGVFLENLRRYRAGQGLADEIDFDRGY